MKKLKKQEDSASELYKIRALHSSLVSVQQKANAFHAYTMAFFAMTN